MRFLIRVSIALATIDVRSTGRFFATMLLSPFYPPPDEVGVEVCLSAFLSGGDLLNPWMDFFNFAHTFTHLLGLGCVYFFFH